MADESLEQQISEHTEGAAKTQEAPVANDSTSLADLQERYLRAENERQKIEWQYSQEKKALQEELESAKANQFSDPIEAFKKLGGNVDSLIDHLSSDGQPNPLNEIKQLKEELSKFRSEHQTAQQKLQQEQLEKTRAAHLNSMAADIFSEIKSAPEANKDIQALLDVQELFTGKDPQAFLSSQIHEPLQRQYRETGKLLTPSELLHTMTQEASGFVDKIRNSEVFQRIMGIQKEPEAAKLTEQLIKMSPPRTPSQQQAVEAHDQTEDIGRVSNARFYQLIDKM